MPVNHADVSDSLTALGAVRCKATTKSTGQRCQNPARKNLDVCRLHGGNAPTAQAAAAERQKALDTKKFLKDSGFWNPDAVDPIIDAVAEYARQGGILKQQQEFLGEQVNITMDCPCCGRKEWDPTILRAMQFVMSELNKLLNNIAKHGIASRHLEIEQQKVAIIAMALIATVETAVPDLDHLQKYEIRRTFLAKCDELLKKAPETNGKVWWQ